MSERNESPAPTSSGDNWCVTVPFAADGWRTGLHLEWRQIDDGLRLVDELGQELVHMPWRQFLERVRVLTELRSKHAGE